MNQQFSPGTPLVLQVHFCIEIYATRNQTHQHTHTHTHTHTVCMHMRMRIHMCMRCIRQISGSAPAHTPAHVHAHAHAHARAHAHAHAPCTGYIQHIVSYGPPPQSTPSPVVSSNSSFGHVLCWLAFGELAPFPERCS
jgi:hypothetical protein